MPIAALRPCAQSGCPALVARGRCVEHAKAQEQGRRTGETWRHARGARGGTIDLYQTSRWKRLRAQVLREAHHLCQCQGCRSCPTCKAKPRDRADLFGLTCYRCGALLAPKPASVADHTIPHRGDQALMWDRDNLLAWNFAEHSAKTMREVRG